MSLLSEVKTIIESAGVPVETGVFSKTPPDRYTVLTPLSDTFDLFLLTVTHYVRNRHTSYSEFSESLFKSV